MVKNRQNVKVLLSEKVISNRVKELARQIEADCGNVELIVIGLLKGACYFFADLTRKLDLNVQIEFIKASSYGSGQVSSGAVAITQDMSCSISGKNVLIVEDIVDTGQTLKAVLNHLWSFSPASIRTCTLVDKPSRRKVSVDVDYIGFTIEDNFVVGYGMDLDGMYRDLPYIGIYSKLNN